MNPTIEHAQELLSTNQETILQSQLCQMEATQEPIEPTRQRVWQTAYRQHLPYKTRALYLHSTLIRLDEMANSSPHCWQCTHL